MKVAIYCRVSTKEQDETLQLKDIYTLISQEEKEISIYQDKQSGWNENKDRKDFERLKLDIKANRLEELYVWDFDRIYRNRGRFKEFLVLLKAYNIKLHSFNQQWLESLWKIPEPWNEIVYELMVNIYGHIAQDESDRKSKRVKLAVRKEQGVTNSYKGNKWGRKAISTFKQNTLEVLANEKPRKPLRQIASEVGISLGVVHKYISKIDKQKSDEKIPFIN